MHDGWAGAARRWTAGSGRTLVIELLRSLRFYSRLPIPALSWETDTHALPTGDAAAVLPVAGAIIGAAGSFALLLAHALGLGSFLCAALAVTTLALVTGALHEDGLADTADGFGGGSTPERRLEIMKDSRIGSYGGAALTLAFVLRIACLTELLARIGAAGAAAAIVFVAALSRAAPLLLLMVLPPARATGSSHAVGRPEPQVVGAAFLVCGGLALVAAFSGALPLSGLLLAFVLTAGISLAMTRLSARLIGGQTGDVGGAIQQLAEILAYLAILIAV
jgi:adenosylcobinamide-GDP ribazoletransferase